MFEKNCCGRCGTPLHASDMFFGCPVCDNSNPKSRIGNGYKANYKRIPTGDMRTFQQFFDDMMNEEEATKLNAGT